MVVAAVMPTSVLPAPQGRTMMPDRARLVVNVVSDLPRVSRTQTAHPLPNILPRLFSWYERIVVVGLRSISRVGLISSCRKSYSSIIG